MKFHEVECVGNLWVHRIPTLTEWTTDDVGRLVFANDKNCLYFGGSLEYGDWISVSEYYLDEGNGVDLDTGETYTGRDYEMKIVNGNIRLYY